LRRGFRQSARRGCDRSADGTGRLRLTVIRRNERAKLI
jgi:hypothetical protein